MEKDALIFPSDISVESNVLEAKVCDAIDSICLHLQEKTRGRGMVVLRDLMDIVEKINPPSITNSCKLDAEEHAIVDKVALHIEEGLLSNEEEFQRAEQELAAKELEEKIIAEELEKEKELARVQDKGKNALVAITPHTSPMKIDPVREVGTNSRGQPQSTEEWLDFQEALIASLVEDSQNQKRVNENVQNTLAQILSMFHNMQQEQQLPPPNPNPQFLCLSTFFVVFFLLKTLVILSILSYNSKSCLLYVLNRFIYAICLFYQSSNANYINKNIQNKLKEKQDFLLKKFAKFLLHTILRTIYFDSTSDFDASES
jgi:hypothetical protein